MKKQIETIIEKNFNSQVKDLQKLIQIDSVYNEKEVDNFNPLGKNLTKTLETFLSIANDKGFKVKNIDNMVGYTEIGTGKKLYGILAHLDTVPFGNLEKWITEPLAAKILDNKIYGRGTADDKGAAIASLYAMKAIKDTGIKLNKRFRLITGLDEESNFQCVQRYLKSEEIPSFSFSPDASFPVVNGEKGILSFAIKRIFTPLSVEEIRVAGITAGERTNMVPDIAKIYFHGNIAKAKLIIEALNYPNIKFDYIDNYLEVTVTGKSTHAMHPEKGYNAIQSAFEILSKIEFAPSELMRWIKDMNNYLKMEYNGSSLGIAYSDTISGILTVNTAVIRYNGKELILKFDIRYPITLKPDIMEEKIKLIAKKFGTLLQIIKHKPPLYISDELKEIQLLLKSYKEVTKQDGKAFTIGGGTYCRAFPNSVSFGPLMPDEEETAHQENEYISLNSLKTATVIYAKALLNLNNT